MGRIAVRSRSAGAALGLMLASPLVAQESIFTPAATQPAVGNWMVHSSFTLYTYNGIVDGEGNEAADSARDFVWLGQIMTGLTPRISLEASLPVVSRQVTDPVGGEEDDDTFGLGDMQARVRWRFWQHDPGPLDTHRLAVHIGMEFPTGDEELSSESFDPIVGLSFMNIMGRHGVNLSATYMFTTGDHEIAFRPGDTLSDLIEVDAAYLFRIKPEIYGASLEAATYLTMEVNSTIETNGDAEVFLSPGILYEAPLFALELGVQIPVYSDVSERAETTLAVMAGVRVLF